MRLFCLLVPAVCTACSMSSLVTSAVQETYTVAIDERSTVTLTSDKMIEWSIEKKIMGDPSINYLNITPYCYDGYVYLVGEFRSLDEVGKVSDIASRMDGVKSVALYFIRHGYTPGCGVMSDLTIHMKVKAKLLQDEQIHSTNVEIKVVQCHVVLLGIVGSPEEIIQCLTLAENVDGVQEVKSFLTTSAKYAE